MDKTEVQAIMMQNAHDYITENYHCKEYTAKCQDFLDVYQEGFIEGYNLAVKLLNEQLAK